MRLVVSSSILASVAERVEVAIFSAWIKPAFKLAIKASAKTLTRSIKLPSAAVTWKEFGAVVSVFSWKSPVSVKSSCRSANAKVWLRVVCFNSSIVRPCLTVAAKL